MGGGRSVGTDFQECNSFYSGSQTRPTVAFFESLMFLSGRKAADTPKQTRPDLNAGNDQL